MSQRGQWVLSFAVVGALAGLFVFLLVVYRDATRATSPPVLHAPISSRPEAMLGMVDFKRRSASEITMHWPHHWGDRFVRAFDRLASLPPMDQPGEHQRWMSGQVHEAINEALGKVGYQASERNLADGQFYVIERTR